MPGSAETAVVDNPSEVRRNIGLRLGIIARNLRHLFDRHVTSLGVTRSQWTMIVVVARHPGATQRMIAEALEMSEASAGRLVDRLCADGFLRRQERDDDRRARAVYLTDKATPMLEQIADIAKGYEASVFKGFSEEELAQFQNYLDRLYHNVTR